MGPAQARPPETRRRLAVVILWLRMIQPQALPLTPDRRTIARAR